MYKHTQDGWIGILALFVIFLPIVFLDIIDVIHISGYGSLIFILTMLFFLLSFLTMTVKVDDKKIYVKYGIGLIRKRILLDRIKSCKIVRNKWWHGFGIRYIGRGWLYNISGLNAVELEFKDNNRIIRIGTDEPTELCNAILQKLNS